MSRDLWAFRTMLTPKIVQIIFWLGAALAVLIGLALGLPALRGAVLRPGRALAVSLGFIIFGPLAVRIYCEMLVLFFRIHETLTEIESTLREPREPGSPPPEAA